MSRRLLHALLRTDFNAFVEKVYLSLHDGKPISRNWHLRAIGWQLMQVAGGKCRRCVITQPPRSLKSIVSSVAFVAWMLGRDPSLKFICVSYSRDLAAELSRMFRAIVTSAWYREAFPALRLLRETELELITSKRGGRLATSIGGTLTGRGADIIIIDDPLKAEEAQSEAARNAVLSWYRDTLVTRLNSKAAGRLVVVMQRLHEEDLAGYLLEQGGWEHLDLPAIAINEQQIPLGPSTIHIRHAGDVLHPEREPLEVLDLMRAQMGSMMFSAQYQQRPVPVDGNLIKREWFRTYKTAPERGLGRTIVQSWDIASSITEKSDYSVCTTWLMERKTYYLLDVFRVRLEYPDLRRRIIDMARAWKCNVLLIENAGPGQSLLQDFRNQPVLHVPVPIPVRPIQSKLMRMEAQASQIEAGQVILPEEAPWRADFLNEVLAFPRGRHDDQIDSLSQFLWWASNRFDGSTIAPQFLTRLF